MRFLRFLVATVFLLLVTSGFAAPEAEGLVTWFADDTLWSVAPDAFMGQHRAAGFRWLTAAKVSARSVGDDLSFLGLPVHECVVRFENDAVQGVTLSLYNRGDVGNRSEEEFTNQVNACISKLNAWTKVRPTPVQKKSRPPAARIYRQTWNTANAWFGLTWSFSKRHRKDGEEYPYRAEYVTLQVVSPAAGQASAGGDDDSRSARGMTKQQLLAGLVKNDKGDLFIDGIPMVDQGQKGYCAAATAERVLRYYQAEVDQHEIAQIAESSAQRGTNPDVMFDALKRVGVKLGVRVKELESFNVQDFQRLVRNYNSEARRADMAQIKLGQMIVVSQVYASMDPALLKAARLQRKSDLRGFVDDVTDYIDQGIPLQWSVLVGIVPETPKVTGFGGHMRLIIGYNAATGQIIYSDSWGRGHELKYMSAEDAWTITTGLYVMESRPERHGM